MMFEIITEGVCKGMKLLQIGNSGYYFNSDLSDEECIEVLLTTVNHPPNSTSPDFRFLNLLNHNKDGGNNCKGESNEG